MKVIAYIFVIKTFFWLDDFLSASSSAFGVTAAAVAEAFSSVKETVATEVSLASEKILKQASLTSEMQNDLQKLIVSIDLDAGLLIVL